MHFDAETASIDPAGAQFDQHRRLGWKAVARAAGFGRPARRFVAPSGIPPARSTDPQYRSEGRPQRSLSMRQWKEIQEMLRKVTAAAGLSAWLPLFTMSL